MKVVSADTLRKAYRSTFGSEAGLLVLDDLRRVAGMGRPSYVPGDSLETVYRDGVKKLVYLIEAHLGDGEQVLERTQAEEQTEAE